MLPWKRHYESGISKEMPFQNPKSAFLWRASNDFAVHVPGGRKVPRLAPIFLGMMPIPKDCALVRL